MRPLSVQPVNVSVCALALISCSLGIMQHPRIYFRGRSVKQLGSYTTAGTFKQEGRCPEPMPDVRFCDALQPLTLTVVLRLCICLPVFMHAGRSGCLARCVQSGGSVALQDDLWSSVGEQQCLTQALRDD